ncbi:Na+/H+ antiporter NhaC family protein [Tissierella praeacuta]|uniref:Na+/H+ antiporter NhaC family protein n=1 Tax=Tissierella praeacuta TaxID=43131 RepID=UPI003341CAE6
MESGYGILALIPPIVAIVMSLITKHTILSLILGVLTGVTIINNWNPLVAIPKMISDYLIPQIGNEWNAGMLMLITACGGFVYLIKISGAGKALGDIASKKIKTRKQAQTVAFFSAFAFIYTEPTLTLGTIMRPITERLRVSRVKLAYICDVMGCPFATLSPITSYSAYATGLIATQLALLNSTENPWNIFVKAIPFNFYAIFGLIALFYVIQTSLDIGPMYKAEKRAIETGHLIGENDNPMERDDDSNTDILDGKTIGIENFIVPMVALFITLFAVIFWTGNIAANGILGSIKESNITLSITTGFIIGGLAAGIMGARAGLYKYSEIVGKFVKGIVLNAEIPIILVLAWSIGAITGVMQLKDFVVSFISGASLPPAILPAIIFIIGAFIAFSTGSSWGVWSIMMPIAIPIAQTFNLPMTLVIGAVLSGGVFGDHCSPISDTTILASTAAGADHIEHVRTQLPYALLVGSSSAIGFGFGGLINPWIGFIATAVSIVIGLNIFHKIAVNQELKMSSNNA